MKKLFIFMLCLLAGLTFTTAATFSGDKDEKASFDVGISGDVQGVEFLKVTDLEVDVGRFVSGPGFDIEKPLFASLNKSTASKEVYRKARDGLNC
jgi:hypothetical protein